ncbi:segregation/condensation protein A, partial [Lysinibacillus xylanilyticus]
ADLSELASDEQMALFDLNVNIYDMLGAFQKLMRRKKLKKPLKTTIARQERSVKDQMRSVVDSLRTTGGRASFSELFPYEDKPTLILTFLSLLELMKRQVVIVEQDGNFEELTVTLQKEEWDDDENIGATE